MRTVVSLIGVAFLAAACSGPGEPAVSRAFDVMQFHAMLNQEMPLPQRVGSTGTATGPTLATASDAICSGSVAKTAYGYAIRGCTGALPGLK